MGVSEFVRTRYGLGVNNGEDADMTDKAFLKDLSGVLADAAAITKLAHELQAKIDAIRKQHELDDTEDLEAASKALLAIYATLEEAISGLEEGQDELSTAMDELGEAGQ
jgi:hypothetical protein